MFRSNLFRRVLCVPLLCAAFAADASVALPTEKSRSEVPERQKEEGAQTLSGAAEDSTRVLRLGDAEVVVPLLRGYLELKQFPQATREFFASVAPPSSTLRDLQLNEEDWAAGPDAMSRWPTYELYTINLLRDLELSQRDWKDFKVSIIAGMAHMDLAELAKHREHQIEQAVDKFAGGGITIETGKLDRPTVYRDSENDIRFVLVVPRRQTMYGKVSEVEEVRAVAALHVRGRLLFVAASREYAPGKARPDEIIDALNAYVDRIFALNADGT